jgi:galactoside O-acetyltransferase
MPPSFYTEIELAGLGLASFGKDCKISRYARLYNPHNITLGNCVRVDDFCVLSAGSRISLGSHVHIAAHSLLTGASLIELDDFSGLSSHVSVYSSSDDYLGRGLTNPTVPMVYRNVTNAPVLLKKHVIVGAGSVILPGVTLEVGCAVGALSLVNKSMPEFVIVQGNPASAIGKRSRRLLAKEQAFLESASA